MEQRHRIILWDQEDSVILETLDLDEKQLELLITLRNAECLIRSVEVIDVDSLTFYPT